jgi:hypothetical protein
LPEYLRQIAKPTNMRSRNTIHLISLAVIVAGIFLVLQAATPAKTQEPCKESMDQCCKKKDGNESNNLIWETLPHQFFSSISFD